MKRWMIVALLAVAGCDVPMTYKAFDASARGIEEASWDCLDCQQEAFRATTPMLANRSIGALIDQSEAYHEYVENCMALRGYSILKVREDPVVVYSSKRTVLRGYSVLRVEEDDPKYTLQKVGDCWVAASQ